MTVGGGKQTRGSSRDDRASWLISSKDSRKRSKASLGKKKSKKGSKKTSKKR